MKVCFIFDEDAELEDEKGDDVANKEEDVDALELVDSFESDNLLKSSAVSSVGTLVEL